MDKTKEDIKLEIIKIVYNECGGSWLGYGRIFDLAWDAALELAANEQKDDGNDELGETK